MSQVFSQVIINAPADQVWEALMDAGHLTQWLPSSVRLDSLVELGGGSSSPKYFHYDLYSTVKERTTQLEAGRSYSYVVSNVGPIKSAYNSLSLSDSEVGTVLSHTVDFRMKYGPLGAMAGSLVFRPQFHKQMQASLAALKMFIEAREGTAARPEEQYAEAA
jgi:uncharacterized membrane protein